MVVGAVVVGVSPPQCLSPPPLAGLVRAARRRRSGRDNDYYYDGVCRRLYAVVGVGGRLVRAVIGRVCSSVIVGGGDGNRDLAAWEAARG